MSIYEASITNPKKQLEFYKDLSEQLKQENDFLRKRENKLQTIEQMFKSGTVDLEELQKIVEGKK